MNSLPTTLPDRDFTGAKRRFVEFYADATVLNRYLKVALLIQSLVILGLIVQSLIVQNLRTQNMVANFKPLVIRIDSTGRAEAVNYTDFEYHPQAPEIRYFLTDFVARHYSRMRATFRDSYARSLYFLDPTLTETAMETNKTSEEFQGFLAGSGEEVDIEVLNVVLQDLRKSPYKATIDFEKQYYGPGRTPRRKELYTANVVFVFQDAVPNNLIPVNPLGLTITYLREDQAFR
jgi:type IV secretory pathway TrbF-like protein